jgi:ATP/ADP translocase
LCPVVVRIMSRFFGIRPGEVYRVGVMASLLFFLIAANNLIKILRDSVFLGHHSVSELPYLYTALTLAPGRSLGSNG